MRSSRAELRETFVYFLRLGFFGFGGPLALVASMQRDLVKDRRWIEEGAFARAFALIKAMPGPVAFQTAVYLGRHRAGWRGGFAAGFGLNAPAFMMMVMFAIFYQSWRDFEASRFFLVGMQAAALGAILASLKGLAASHWRKPIFWLLGSLAAGATLLSPALEPLVILASGGAAVLFSDRKPESTARGFALTPALVDRSLLIGDWNTHAAAMPFFGAHADLLWSCFKSGAFVFGSGLAIVPMMEHDFVTRLGWLTHQQFMDALAFGQITPGPVVITAAFIGFQKFGILGACTATLAINLAPFIHTMTWFPRFVDRLSQLTWIPAFLTGAIAAVIGSIVATVVRLGLSLEMVWLSWPLFGLALLLALFGRVPIWLLIPTSGIALALIGFFSN